MQSNHIALLMLQLARWVGLVNRLELREVAQGRRTQWQVVTHGWLGGRTLLDEPLYAPNLILATDSRPPVRNFSSPELAIAFLRRVGLGSLCRAA